jgi:hypothetical protein
VDEQGRDNLPRPIRKTDEPEKPLNYLISDLVATNARVRYENRVRNIDVNLPVAKVTIQGDRLASDFDESPQADVALHARVDAARAAAIARFTEPISGLFDIDGTAKGNLPRQLCRHRFAMPTCVSGERSRRRPCPFVPCRWPNRIP